MEKLDPETIEAFDKLFNSWLVNNNFLSKDGYLYKTDNQGKILQDKNGAPVKVDSQQFKSLMADPVNGFQAYAAKKGLNVTPVEQKFPE